MAWVWAASRDRVPMTDSDLYVAVEATDAWIDSNWFDRDATNKIATGLGREDALVIVVNQR